MGRPKLLAVDCAPPLFEGVEINRVDAAAMGLGIESLEEDIAAIVLGGHSATDVTSLLRDLRKHPSTCLLPIYVVEEAALPQALADGAVPADLSEEIHRFLDRRRALAIDPLDSFENRAVGYLWLLERRRIFPDKVIEEAGIYRYEPLRLWAGAADVDNWMATARRNGLIERDDLVDRLRLCSRCQSAHLNYIDTCPHCGAIDIAEESALHCFTCGHVGSQERFLRQGKLVCPNCQTALKHLGTDYDRPIENHRCNQCRQMFIDGTVVAVCLDCGQNNALDELKQRAYHRYALGYTGHIMAREGAAPAAGLVTYGEPLTREHFIWLLTWLNHLAEPRGAEHAVLGLRFPNLVEMRSGLCEAGLLAHIEELGLQLRNLLQAQEVYAQYDDDKVFVCLPFAGSGRARELESDIQRVCASQLQHELTVSIVVRPLASAQGGVDPADWLRRFADELGT